MATTLFGLRQIGSRALSSVSTGSLGKLQFAANVKEYALACQVGGAVVKVHQHQHRCYSVIPMTDPEDFEEAGVEETTRTDDGVKKKPHKFYWQTKKAKSTKKVKTVEFKPVGVDRLNELYQELPELEEIEVDKETLRRIIGEAALYGISPSRCAKIIMKLPEFVSKYHTLLPEATKTWRRLGVTEQDRSALFYKAPHLMTISQNKLAIRHAFLNKYFSKSEISKLFKNCPSVAIDDERVIQEKMELLYETYNHSTEAIASCDALKKPTFTIKLRHEFLQRAGLIRPVHFFKFLKFLGQQDQRRVKIDRDKYFLPTSLVCSSPEKFVQKCCKNSLLTVEELDAFENMFVEEEKARNAFEHLEALPEDFEFDEDEGERVVDIDADETSNVSAARDIKYSHSTYFYKNSASVGFYSVKDCVDFYY